MGTFSTSCDWLRAQGATLSPFPLAAMKDESTLFLRIYLHLSSRSRTLLPFQEPCSTARFLFLKFQRTSSLQYLNVIEPFSTFRKTSLNSTVPFNFLLSFTVKLIGMLIPAILTTSLPILSSAHWSLVSTMTIRLKLPFLMSLVTPIPARHFKLLFDHSAPLNLIDYSIWGNFSLGVCDTTLLLVFSDSLKKPILHRLCCI